MPGVANIYFAVHTYGLERSPLTLLLGSYLRGPMRAFASEPPVGDPFCFDFEPPTDMGPRGENTWGVDERVTIRAMFTWMDERRREAPDRPVMVAYTMVTGHHPYEFPGSPPAAHGDDEAERRMHAATLGFIDDRVRDVHDELARRGMLDDTLLVVVSDHGPGSGRPGMGKVPWISPPRCWGWWGSIRPPR